MSEEILMGWAQARADRGRPIGATTLKNARFVWLDLCHFLERRGRTPVTCTSSDIAVWAASERPRKDTSTRRYLLFLRKVFNYLIHVKRRTDNPVDHVLPRYPAPVRGLPDALTEFHDIRLQQSLKGELDTGSWRDVRNRAIAALLHATGIGPDEAVALRLSDVVFDADPPFVNVPGTHERQARMIALTELAEARVVEWAQLRMAMAIPGVAFFVANTGGRGIERTTVYRAVKKIFGDDFRQPGVNNPRALRATFAVRQLASQVPMAEVKEWMGNRTEESLLGYKQLTKTLRRPH